MRTDPDLAVHAEAWYLAYLGQQLIPSWVGDYKRDELLAIGYNGGPDSMNTAAGNPANGTPPTPDEIDPAGHLSWYLANVRQNWPQAHRLFCDSGAFDCSYG